MNEQVINQEQQLQAQTFTWEQVQAELDHQAAGNQLEQNSAEFITNLAGQISTNQEAGMTIQGTDEWIPGSTTYSYERSDAEGNTTTEEVSPEVASRVKQFAAERKAENEAAAKRDNFLAEVGAAVEANPDRPDQAMKDLKLTQNDIIKMGYTRFGELATAAKPVHEVRKAEAAAQAKLDREAARAAESKRAHEEAWANNAAYAAEVAKDQKIAEVGELAAYKMSVSELSELTGLSQSEIHNKGKDYAIKMAQARIAERTAKSTQSAEDNLGVTRNTAAQERTSELAALLKAHDRKMGQPAVNPTELGGTVGTGGIAWDAIVDAEPVPGAARVTDRGLNRPASLWGDGYPGRPSSNRDAEPAPAAQPQNIVERGADGRIIRHVAVDGMWAAPNAEDVVQSDEAYFATQIEQPAPRMSRWNRIKSVMFNATPAMLIQNFNTRRQERGEQPRSRRALMGLGALAAAGVGVYFANRAGAFDQASDMASDAWDNINNLWEGSDDVATQATTGGTGTGSGNLANAADMLGGNTPSGSGTGSANLEAAADMLSGDAHLDQAATAAEQAASTFTVNEVWQPGSPTAWSWAESQGIPSGNVDNFLHEVMGSDWQEQARGMQIGDSLSATAEQIAKYKS